MAATLDAVRKGGKRALAQTLAAIEGESEAPELIRLLDEAWASPRAHLVGLTGPPGVGKSTLIRSLIAEWRKSGFSVGVIAVDPSSRQSGGALLGDRLRIARGPEDENVFIRSMAARDRLGGLARVTAAASVLMRAVFDRVIVETVGVGQSETDIADLADTVTLCIQPGSGDALQFMKAGIMETPDVVVVTKADLGDAANRALADVKSALGVTQDKNAKGQWAIPVLSVSAANGTGLEDLAAALQRHRDYLNTDLDARRRAQAQIWLEQSLRDRFGREGLAWLRTKAPDRLILQESASPFSREAEIAALFRERFKQ